MMDARQVTNTLGGKRHGRYGTAPCPVCQPEGRRRQNALTLADGRAGLLAHCKKSHCAFADILAAAGIAPGDYMPLDPATIAQREADRRAEAAKRARQAARCWNEAQPIPGTLAETYLRARGITAPLPETLRFVPDIYHRPSGSWRCALVAKVQPTGGIHLTYLTKKGERLPKSAEIIVGPVIGGAVALSEAERALVVCTGVETGLCLLSGLLKGPASVRAALSPSGLETFELPNPVGKLIIAPDGNEADAEAAAKLAARAKVEGWKVSHLPAPKGKSWGEISEAHHGA